MDQNLEIVVIVATAFLVFVLSTTDLGIDLLGIDRARLPTGLQNLVGSIASEREAEGETRLGTLRRVLDVVMSCAALAAPLLLFARVGLNATAISWSAILEVANLTWIAWLLGRPRRRRPGSARGAAAQGGSQDGRRGGKAKRRRR